MRPPSHRPHRLIMPSLMLAVLAISPAAAQETAPLPTCHPTVAVPPPEPPSRPDGLADERLPNPPIAAAPLPPERPADLPSVSDTSPPAALPAPTMQPSRPSEPSSVPALQLNVAPPPPADLPSCTPTVETPPLPPGRPAALSPNVAPGPAAPTSEPARPPVAPQEAPLPPDRPPGLSGDETASEPEDTDCLHRLDGLGVRYAKLAPTVNGQCSLPHPLSVTSLADGIGIGAPATMTCRLAEGLALWTTQVREAADKELGDALKGFTLGGTYVCRGQNHGAEAQLSEHSFANAADVMGFTFAKRAPILVGSLPEGSKEAAFVSAVRKQACDAFSTVLGPGSDEHHANHLHLDQRERKAGYRLCQ